MSSQMLICMCLAGDIWGKDAKSSYSYSIFIDIDKSIFANDYLIDAHVLVVVHVMV